MSVLNIFQDVFSDAKEKAKFMIVLSTIMACFEYCIDRKIEPSVQVIIDYLKDKADINLDAEAVTEFLNILTGNVKIFIMFMINEYSEKLAESMIDNPSAMVSNLRRTV